MLIRLLPGYYLWQINPKPDNPTVRCIKIRYIPAEQTSVTQDDIISLTVQTIPLPQGLPEDRPERSSRYAYTNKSYCLFRNNV